MCQRRMNRQSLVRKGQRVYWVVSHVPFCGSFSLRENGRTFAGEDLGVREGQHAGSTASVCRREQEGRVREKRYVFLPSGVYWELLGSSEWPYTPSGMWLCSAELFFYSQSVRHFVMPRTVQACCCVAPRWSVPCLIAETAVLKHDPVAPYGAVWSERAARQRADDSAFAGPRSPAPPARGGASGHGCAALARCSCLRWW